MSRFAGGLAGVRHSEGDLFPDEWRINARRSSPLYWKSTLLSTAELLCQQ